MAHTTFIHSTYVVVPTLLQFPCRHVNTTCGFEGSYADGHGHASSRHCNGCKRVTWISKGTKHFLMLVKNKKLIKTFTSFSMLTRNELRRSNCFRSQIA